MGGFLVALAAVIVFAASLARAGTHDQRYVVVAQALAGGTVITPGDLTTAAMQLPVGSRAVVFAQTGIVVGRTLSVAVQPGELLESSMLLPVGSQSTLRPVSVEVDPDSLQGLTSDASVDVLAAVGTGSSTEVSLVMRGAALIAVSRDQTGILTGPSTGTLVTLGVSTLAEVEAIVEASQSGTISLVTAEPSDGVGPGSGAGS